MHVLIVDDEAEVARVLAECVSGEGHTVTIAHRGLEALDALERERPDVVFLDVVMPDMSGIEVLRHIRESHADLAVMLLSGRADVRTLAEARGLGVTDVIGKPSGLRYLDEALASVEATRLPSAGTAGKPEGTGPLARDTQGS